MAEQAITQGSIRAIFDPNGSTIDHPVMQCVQLKTIEPKAGDQSAQPRFRIVLSDMRNFIQTMLATAANDLVTSGKLKKGSIVRLLKFNPQLVKEKMILIILDLEVLDHYGEHEKIGNPVALDMKPDVKPQPAAISGDGFYGNKPAPQPQPPQRALPSHTAKPSSSAYPNLYPIESLSPYAHKWTIRVRCTFKSDIKTWHNKNGEGKLFSVNLLDETGEIRATGFTEACDRLYDMFQVDSIYYISTPCRVTFAKKQFSNLPNDYELTFEKDTEVEKAEDQSNAPKVRYSFTKIGELPSVEKDTTIDTIGILKEVGEVATITSQKTNKDFDKRELVLADDTQTNVRLTIWGKTATNFDAPLESVIAFKGVKVSDFGVRSLSLLSSGSMTIDPDIEEAHQLKGWYDRNSGAQFNSLASMAGNSGGGPKTYKLISQILEEEVGLTADQPSIFDVKASTVYIKHNNATLSYPACQSEGCSKKVLEENPGEWWCEKCQKKWPKPEYRYIMQVNVADHTGQMWLSCFDKQGRGIMGMSADQLQELKLQDEQNGTHTFDDALQDATCKQFSFKVKASMEVYNDSPRIRYAVLGMYPINYSQECRRLTEMLKQYEIGSDSLFVH
ncbi:replication protein-like protein A 70 kDa DNA-binding subunit [Delitschia confertaspora ATCC 74209]|uniref:Replication protein A subunit n=1 Tax=Delitschia confertaspora ATCC 74209 TaxID=1513339 RepID=A0A9P4JSU7_9PLEO|nr:replication protein-like protein A 70 kDa DNA-binding subunit [Delitschia confertaspora ATCC 74209]